jgi:Toprim-like
MTWSGIPLRPARKTTKYQPSPRQTSRIAIPHFMTWGSASQEVCVCSSELTRPLLLSMTRQTSAAATGAITWGGVPRGQQFVRAVVELAERAGIDPAPINSAGPRDRRADLLEEFFALCQSELAGKPGSKAHVYLEQRGFPRDAIETAGIGLVPRPGETRRRLEHAGYRQEEIAAAGVLADSRWPGRLCGAWRNEHGRIGSLWARTVEGAGTRYLYLRDARRTDLPPYGLSEVLARSSDMRRQIVLVEGLMDVHQLRAHGIENVAALGGTSLSPVTFERLHRLCFESVTLCLDNDDAGRAAAVRGVEHSARARHSPEVYVIEPERLAPEKDPDAFVQAHGPHRWAKLVETRSCGIAWRAGELAGDVRPDWPAPERRAALARAGRWLGALPPRLALEQEDAVRSLAERCGYSPAAVERAFRVRYWTAPESELPRRVACRPPLVVER